MRRIGQHLAAPPALEDDERLVRAQQPLEHGHQPADRLVQIHQPGLVHLPPAEGEELLGDAGGAGGPADHLLHIGGLGMVGAQLLEHEVAEAKHGHQLVVDLVGHPAGERADGLELLGLAELLLGQDPVGDVGVGADPFTDFSPLVQDRHRPHLHVAVLPVVTLEAVLGQHRPPLPHRFLPPPQGFHLDVRMDRLEPAA